MSGASDTQQATFEYRKLTDYPSQGTVVRVRFHPSVTAINKGAFNQCEQLKEVVLNEGLQVIMRNAFSFCVSLERIALPSTLIEVGDFAFEMCTNLKEVVLNEGLKKIGAHAFKDCKSLRSISLPSTVTIISRPVTFKGAFKGCRRLEEFVIRNENIDCDIIKQVQKACPYVWYFNFPSISTRLNNIIKNDHWSSDIEAKIVAIPRVERRRNGDVVVLTRSWVHDTSGGLVTKMAHSRLVKQTIDEIISWIRYYEIKEATTTLELALWKAKIDRVDDGEPANRDACRIEVPGPVKDIILQYL